LHEYYLKNKEKIRQRNKEWYLKNKNKITERRIIRERLRPDVVKEKRRLRYLKDKEKIKKQSSEWRKNHPEKFRAALTRSRLKNRIEVLTYYGGGKLACVICGYNDKRALSIDHINGGGIKHRKDNRVAGHIARWLSVNGFPDGFRTLCMNCQYIERERLRAGRRWADVACNTKGGE
jgi:hypothetical protein